MNRPLPLQAPFTSPTEPLCAARGVTRRGFLATAYSPAGTEPIWGASRGPSKLAFPGSECSRRREIIFHGPENGLPRVGLSRSLYVAPTRAEAFADAEPGIRRHARQIGQRTGLGADATVEQLRATQRMDQPREHGAYVEDWGFGQ